MPDLVISELSDEISVSGQVGIGKVLGGVVGQSLVPVCQFWRSASSLLSHTVQVIEERGHTERLEVSSKVDQLKVDTRQSGPLVLGRSDNGRSERRSSKKGESEELHRKSNE